MPLADDVGALLSPGMICPLASNSGGARVFKVPRICPLGTLRERGIIALRAYQKRGARGYRF